MFRVSGLDVEDLDERASLSDDSSSSGRAELADAEPEFYDPDADERNERWVARLRAGSRTDAILSCPQCFTTLCVECEQHATRDNQFRARHVLNCRLVRRGLLGVSIPCRRASVY